MLNFYTIPNVENFAIINSSGDIEYDNYLDLFLQKIYTYSKLLIYLIADRGYLGEDYIRKNTNFEALIKFKLKYNIPLLILLTHFDIYCKEVKKSELNWENICKNTLKINKENILNYIKNEIIKSKEFKFNQDDILYTVLIEPKKITDEDIVNKFDEDTKEEYINLNEKEKRKMIKAIRIGMNLRGEEFEDFFKEMKIYKPKELAEKIKEKIPIKYHNALIELK